MDILRTPIYFIITAFVTVGLTAYFVSTYVNINKIYFQYDNSIYVNVSSIALYSLPDVPITEGDLEKFRKINLYGRYLLTENPRDLVREFVGINNRVYLTTGSERRIVSKKTVIRVKPEFIYIVPNEESGEFEIYVVPDSNLNYNNLLNRTPTYCFSVYDAAGNIRIVCSTADTIIEEIPS